METTVPSVKSLLVRARISLAEAAEARQLNCEEVREELGEVAEGLVKMSAPVRRHMRDCERCRLFRKHLKDNNHALAAILPVGPLLMLKKLIFAKLGSTASAGGAHVAGGATAGVAGAASAGGVGMGSLATAGAGALATKAAATLAAAALVTAGAVEADHVGGHTHRHHPAQIAAVARPTIRHEAAPIVVSSTPQPLRTVKSKPTKVSLASTHAHHPAKPVPTNTAADTAPAPDTAPATVPTKPVSEPKPAVAPVTQVTTETTQLPTSPQPAEPEAAAPVAPTATTPTTPPPAPEEQTDTDTTSAPTPPPAEESVPSTSTPVGTPQPITSDPAAPVSGR
jgi:hypothetical protein